MTNKPPEANWAITVYYIQSVLIIQYPHYSNHIPQRNETTITTNFILYARHKVWCLIYNAFLKE
jgi:hypothetical protein